MASAHPPISAAPRNESLDALRGFAILAMVLSGSIAFGGALPAWMYHAQVPPPDHVFNPALPGITWVDLVFPFFLFSMGAAIPLALQKAGTSPHPMWWVLQTALRRGLQLAWFALFLQHMKAWVINPEPDAKAYLLSITAFVLLFFQFYQGKGRHWLWVKMAAFALGAYLLYILPFHGGKGFQFDKSDIIILVLANMAFFGTLVWYLTRNHPWLRIGILPGIMAVFLAGKQTGTINEAVFNFSPVPWLYKFYYLKYLFIVIPGTFTGEWMLQRRQNINEPNEAPIQLTGLLSFVLICSNTFLLFSRQLVLNFILTAGLLALLLFLNRHARKGTTWKLMRAGAYLLLLGLLFEAFEGGIKKDPSTYSYYFVTTGLAMFSLISLDAWAKSKAGNALVHYLSLNGRNPMVAYVAGALLLTPLLHLTQLQTWFDQLNVTAFGGFLKGFLYTTLVSLCTIFFTHKKWFWKT